jgi:hypothetical protein
MAKNAQFTASGITSSRLIVTFIGFLPAALEQW